MKVDAVVNLIYIQVHIIMNILFIYTKYFKQLLYILNIKLKLKLMCELSYNQPVCVMLSKSIIKIPLNLTLITFYEI